jgi:outer membrane immunogenic protein
MKFSIVAISVAASLSAASAADMLTPVPYDWSGFYLGAVGGGEWATTTLHEDHSMTGSGAVGGIDAGLRFQISKLVFGADADIVFGNVRGQSDSHNIATTSNVNRVATIAGVAGVAHDTVSAGSWLLYGKGGTAWGKPSYVNQDFYQTCTSGGFFFLACDSHNVNGTGSDPRYGFTVGAGIEWAFIPNWSVKVEYDYIDLLTGSTKFVYPTPNGNMMNSFGDTTRINQVKVGLRWKFAPMPW